jgi:hypothetical protein
MLPKVPRFIKSIPHIIWDWMIYGSYFDGTGIGSGVDQFGMLWIGHGSFYKKVFKKLVDKRKATFIAIRRRDINMRYKSKSIYYDRKKRCYQN